MDHYATLQVSRHAEPEVIEKAYKALCLKYHPDVVPAARRRAAHERMKRINVAYSILKDPASRARYDRTLSMPSGPSAWDTFMSKGLLGMLLEKVTPPRP